MLSFLKGRAAIVLTLFLVVQCTLFYGFSRGETPPVHRPLDQFPQDIGGWHMIQQGVMEQEIKDVLRADDYVTREYATPAGNAANLFVAFFNSQRAGQAPHSPKNCLPGSGWVWTVSDTIPVTVPGRSTPIEINRYVVAKGEDKGVVLYWYQSRDRVVAKEYTAAAYVAWDALRYNRSDTAIVKVTIGMVNNQQDAATQAGIEFIQAFFPTLRRFFPE
ncbi:MAG TPA: EpsI family protein [Bryobacteraceae bacterium]|nr:EpsI family protein [Bryobacteraceae bacterium]